MSACTSADFSAFDTRVAAEIAAGDWQTALRSFHTLKGAAGNMGARALSERARECEYALRDKQVENIQGLLAPLAAELRTVCESLRNFSLAESPSVADAGVAAEPARLAPGLLVDLERALDDADPVEARTHLQALRAAQRVGDEEKLEKLIRAVDDFDFDLARVLLKDICNNALEGFAAVEC